MATSAQIDANRANAQFSTGPRSAEGKATASRNSFKLGITAQSMIIPGEDPAGLDQLTADYEQHFQPVGVVETDLLETIVRAVWMVRRYDRIETSVINSRLAALKDTEHALGAVFIQDSQNGDTLVKIFRRRQAAQRDRDRAMGELRRLQAERRRAERPPATRSVARESCPDRVRFDSAPQPAAKPVPEPPVNLALRL